MDITLSSADLAFRDEVRAFLDEHLPPQTQRAAALNVASLFEPDVSRPWHEILYRKGWAAPGWPKKYGGQEWTPIQQYIWRMESWRAGAPVISQLGMRLVSPVLLHFGTEEQKARFLPPLLSGKDYWCQGFSEPGAGSDLAALQCRARRDGDSYVVNGTKLWQTHAHHANWMITLVRTSTAGRPQDGVSCLLIDLRSPGITLRPILTIGGDHEVNQIFLDDVHVPAENLLGAEGMAWPITKHLLIEERKSAGNAVGRLRFNFGSLLRLLERHPQCWDDPDIVARVGEIATDIDAIEVLELKLLTGASGEAGEVGSSTIKLRASVLEQAVAELAVRALGEDALRWETKRPLHDADAELSVLEDLAAMPRHLNARARTIYGGSTEVQLEIIGKTLLQRPAP